MRKTPRQIVDEFVGSDEALVADSSMALAKSLRPGGYRVAEVNDHLKKALKGNRLFSFVNDAGQTVFETRTARLRRLELPKGTSRRRLLQASREMAVVS